MPDSLGLSSKRIILFCNTASGINSFIGYNTDILLQSGLSDVRAHWGYVMYTFFNFLMRVIGMTLVDRKGRKFRFLIRTSGIIVSLLLVGTLFLLTEGKPHDVGGQIQSMTMVDQQLTLRFDQDEARRLMAAKDGSSDSRVSLAVIYSYGGFTATTSTVRSDNLGAAPIQISRASCIPSSKIEAFFRNPFVSLVAAAYGTSPHRACLHRACAERGT